jgi:hypothetical protein
MVELPTAAVVMPARRPRRIVRRAVMVLAGIVLLVAAYLSAFVGWNYCLGAGTVAPWAVPQAQTLFAPIDVYRNYGGPGVHQIDAIGVWGLKKGLRSRGFDLDSAASDVDQSEK